MLTDGIIRSEAAGASYAKGREYYLDGAVRSLRFSEEDNRFTARVTGWNFYSVSVNFDQQHSLRDYECDCPAFQKYQGACKHVVAVLMKIQKDWKTYFGTELIDDTLPLTLATRKLLAFYRSNLTDVAAPVQPETVNLIPIFAFSIMSGGKTSWLEFMIGTERMYVVKDIPRLLEALANNQELNYGKAFSLQPSKAVFTDSSKALLDMLSQAYTEEKDRSRWSYSASAGSAFSDPRRFKLTNTNLLRFFAVMKDRSFAAQINQQSVGDVQIRAERPPVNLSVNAISGGLKLSMNLADDVFYGLDKDFHYLYHRQSIYQVDDAFAKQIKPLLNCFSDNRKPEAYIPATLVSDFIDAMLPALETIGTVHMDDSINNRFFREPLEKRVFLDKYGDGMSARIELQYGKIILNPADPTTAEPSLQDKWLLRSTAEESQLLGLFRKHGFTAAAGKLVQSDEMETYNFLQQTLPELRDIAEVYHTDEFKPVNIKQMEKITAGVRLNTDRDMLELSLHYGDVSPKDLIELLSAYKLKKRYHRLRDGSFIPLDSPDFQTAANLIQQLGLRTADIEKPVIALPKYRAMYLDSVARENTDFSIERNSAFKRMVQDIREPQDIEYTVPKGIKGKLREYQKTGFKWLKSLANYGFGGILADDMGLGKTLQVLTFILLDKAEKPAPSLVIAPTSLIYNWQEEAAKFTPDLKVIVISGQQAERQERLQDIGQADLVVTSYGLIKRDIELYEEFTFKYCFLDEAQNVKNPNTMNAKSVKQLKASSYFALTGTPIENTLTELWSIFDFIMPGYLRTHKQFTSRFETPIVKNGDQTALQELNRHIKPFILRRMKKTVLKELPEKIESKMTCEMTDEQAKLYGAWLLQAQAEFEQEMVANGFAKSQIKILSLLTRLRQICCHPSLFLENYQGGSGKLEMLQEILQDAIDGGHRVLLFSQFTSMLGMIQQDLDAMQISYHYLDGSTKAEERIRLVNSFNSGEKAVFLISLKAGGTGLNLTGADMVIHFDPWWNPAVEDQATDRAYRIGQKNSVQVYKLITRNTIEDKIYTLQQKKKEMIDALIKPGENFLTKMSEDEIRELFRQ
ncbi:helicase SNF2 [Anaerosporomusa subterranea]|uniref:Helicase SNF2 n=2 Tax=Anaerosporomusa subterranea TaxID=1794912 RepID=A0A154BN86_ANASB|nr:helicase SNF2 [Anaerosporomusa subterranea]